MKTITILTCLLFIGSLCSSQESSEEKAPDKIGITFSSFGEIDVIRFQNLDGAASFSGNKFFTLGICYLHPLNKSLFLETGIEYSNYSIFVNPNLPPDMDAKSYKNNFSILNIPITMRAVFLKYLFFNGGLMIDIDASTESAIDSQTGIGGLLGIGANYDFAFGASIFVNPYFKAHSLIPFTGEKYPQRVLESGIKIGVTYHLDRN